MIAGKRGPWPELPFQDWKETCETLHLWTQVVGKVRLALTPWLNHSWHVPLYVNARSLTTSPIYYEGRAFEIVFDFDRHRLDILTSDGWESHLPLEPRTVADFFKRVMAELGRAGVQVEIDQHPFSPDRVHAAYDRDFAHRFWQALLQADRVLKQFRTHRQMQPRALLLGELRFGRDAIFRPPRAAPSWRRSWPLR